MKQPIPLATIAAEVATCKRCPLWQTRTHTVFGDGDPHAQVLIVGEAPGRTEDEQGLPFVGAAGHLLDEMLSLAGLSRSDVFIANVLKCRPPNNRNPLPEEIEQCVPYLREQTRTINPRFIVTLGNFSTQFILKTGVGIMRLHGRLQKAGRFYVLPMFHPAYVLRNGSQRPALEDDWRYLGRLLKTDDLESELAR